MLAAERDWQAWHRDYDAPGSELHARLTAVQRLVRAALDSHRAGRGRIQVVSVCAGRGRDLLEVLPEHSVRARVAARLVELDPGNAAVARDVAQAANLSAVEVVTDDASTTDAYLGSVPADLVLLCGVFGNIPDRDVETTIRSLPQLCAAGAFVVWTRHRRPPDLTPTIRGWFAEAGFVERAFVSPGESSWAVGLQAFEGEPVPLVLGRKLFAFGSR